MSKYTKENINSFLDELTALCHKHLIYIEDGFGLIGADERVISDDVEFHTDGYEAKQVFNVKMEEG